MARERAVLDTMSLDSEDIMITPYLPLGNNFDYKKFIQIELHTEPNPINPRHYLLGTAATYYNATCFEFAPYEDLSDPDFHYRPITFARSVVEVVASAVQNDNDRELFETLVHVGADLIYERVEKEPGVVTTSNDLLESIAVFLMTKSNEGAELLKNEGFRRFAYSVIAQPMLYRKAPFEGRTYFQLLATSGIDLNDLSSILNANFEEN